MSDLSSHPLLGLIKERGLIDDLQLEEVLQESARTAKPISQILQDFGLVDLDTQLQITLRVGRVVDGWVDEVVDGRRRNAHETVDAWNPIDGKLGHASWKRNFSISPPMSSASSSRRASIQRSSSGRPPEATSASIALGSTAA